MSGQKKIRMAELKQLYESLGFLNVATYLQSGNVVFDSAVEDGGTLAGRIETGIEQAFGFDVSVFVRVPEDFKRILSINPFLVEREEDLAALYVTFLYDPPDETKIKELVVPAGETAEFVIGEDEIFLFYPDGYGRTKLTNTYLERKLDVPATTRNWNTVQAVYTLAVRA